ncbi:MAG: hypothetical protein ACQPRH_04810 [Solitalea-like symbiont of Tyrophagus putrescentiae]
MTTFKRTTYVGERPVCTNQPIMVTGGFTMDTQDIGFTPGDVIPAGTLAEYNEITRKVKVLKTGKVKSISDDKTVITLETNPYFRPLFAVGELVCDGRDNYTITKIEACNDIFNITLDKECPDLQSGDMIVGQDDINKRYINCKPTALVITDTIVCDPIDQTGIDISTDSGAGAWYLRRIPPIPGDLIDNNLLKNNPHIKFTKSA